MRSQQSLKPHDVVVLLALTRNPHATYRALAAAAGVSLGGAHAAVERLELSRLMLKDGRFINLTATLEFLVHGVPYVFPGQLGPSVRGVPTAYSAPPLSAMIEGSAPVVWPSRNGAVRGHSLTPLSATAPGLATSNGDLYHLLTAVDAIRIGRARERELARQFLNSALVRS